MKLRLLLGLSVCLAIPLFMGSSVVSQAELDSHVGGHAVGNCNIPDGHSFSYTDCTGGSACDGQSRDEVKVPPFGSLVHLYEMPNH